MKINLSQELSLAFLYDAEGVRYTSSTFPAWFTVNDFAGFKTEKITEYLRVEFEITSDITGYELDGFEDTASNEYGVEYVNGRKVCYTVTKTAMTRAIEVPFRYPLLQQATDETPRPQSFTAVLRFIGITDCGIEPTSTSGDSPTPEPTPGPTADVEFESVYLDQGDSYTWPSGYRESSGSNPPNNYPPSYSEFSQIWDEEDINLRLVFMTGITEDEAKVWEWGRFINEDDSMVYEKVDQFVGDEYDNPHISGWEGNGTYYVTDNRENNSPADNEGGEE